MIQKICRIVLLVFLAISLIFLLTIKGVAALPQQAPLEQTTQPTIVVEIIEPILIEEIITIEEETIVEEEIFEEEDIMAPAYAEYPIAAQVWNIMKNEFDWNDIVCAGIMGNLMAETGGGTLELDWDSCGESGYGLVQWVGSRRIAIHEKYSEFPTVAEQIQFMYDELYGTNGVTRQVTDDQLDAIMNAKTADDCAYKFALYFERCTYPKGRIGLGQKAYDYFVN